MVYHRIHSPLNINEDISCQFVREDDKYVSLMKFKGKLIEQVAAILMSILCTTLDHYHLDSFKRFLFNLGFYMNESRIQI